MAFDYSLLDDELEDRPVLPTDPNAPAEDPNALLEIINSDPELIAAREEKSRRLAQAGIGQGLSEIGTALASQGRVKASTGAYDDARKSADSLVDDARKSVTGKTKIVSDFIKGQSAKAKALKSDEKFDKKFNQQNDLIAAIRGEKAAAVEREKEKTLKADVEDVSKALKPVQELSSALSNVEKIAGFSLDDATIDPSTKELMVGGKAKDLPGVSLPFAGRVSAYSSDARSLAGAIAAVFNKELKDKAGSTVTNPEMERLRIEFGAGKFNTEAEMIDALKRYKQAVSQEFKNREAGFDPAVVGRYTQQGGTTSKSVGSGHVSEVKRKTKDGKTAIFDGSTKQFLRYE